MRFYIFYNWTDLASACLIVILILLGTNDSFSQKKSSVVGLDIGGAYSYLPSYDNSRILGYTFGIYTERNIINKLNWTTGLFLNQKGGENGKTFPNDRVGFKYKYKQLSLPLTINYQVFNRVSLQAGIYGGWNFGKHLEYQVNVDDLAESTFDDDDNYTTEDEFLNFEFGTKVGLRFKFSKLWFVELNVSNALTPIYNKNFKNKLLVIKNLPNLNIDPALATDLDNRLLNAKNVFISIEVKRNLFNY